MYWAKKVHPYRGQHADLVTSDPPPAPQEGPFLGLGYLVDPIGGQQPHISIYKVKRFAVCKLIALIFKRLLDDGNRILNPQGILKFFSGLRLHPERHYTFTEQPSNPDVPAWIYKEDPVSPGIVCPLLENV